MSYIDTERDVSVLHRHREGCICPTQTQRGMYMSYIDTERDVSVLHRHREGCICPT